MTDFKDAPESLAIVRAERAENASLCPPRDILIELLRQIDKGLDVDLCVIAYRAGGTPPPRGRARYLQAGGAGLHDSLGLLDRVQYMMNKDGD